MKQVSSYGSAGMVDQAAAWGLELSAEQVDSLRRYANFLANYDRVNVIGTRNPTDVLLDHVTDALSCFLTGYLTAGRSLIDVGTGGGLPGLPLKLARAGLHLSLLEATSKKVRFLREAAVELDLTDLDIVNQRVELVGRESGYRDRFDLATARAVAALPVVVEYCAPLVSPGGHVIAMRGTVTRDEIRAATEAAKLLGAELEKVTKVEFLPEMVQKDRHLVVFRKKAPTPGRFPRRVGLAKQRPLGAGGRR